MRVVAMVAGCLPQWSEARLHCNEFVSNSSTSIGKIRKSKSCWTSCMQPNFYNNHFCCCFCVFVFWFGVRRAQTSQTIDLAVCTLCFLLWQLFCVKFVQTQNIERWYNYSWDQCEKSGCILLSKMCHYVMNKVSVKVWCP